MADLLHAVLNAHGGPDNWRQFRRVVSERLDPRASFDGHEFATPWDPLQRAYFNGYAPAVQYVYDIGEADGIKMPSKRRAYRADAQGNAMPDQLMVAIDLSDISFE